MLPAFKGRINRKTFILGNLVGLSILGFAALIYIVPLAVIDIIVNGSGNASSVFKILYGFFLIPVIFYAFFFAVLFVKRMHDVGYPGLLAFWTMVILEGASHLLDIWLLNIMAFGILAAVCLAPGQRVRNSFGPKPGKVFRKESLIIKF